VGKTSWIHRASAVCVVAALCAAGCSSGGSNKASTATTLAAPGAGSSTTQAATATSAAPAGTPIVLGSVETLTSSLGTFDAISDKAIDAWASWVNSHGGINGHPVKIIIKDDGGDQARSVAAAHELVEQDHVVAFINVGSGALISGWADYMQQKGVPVVGGAVFSPIWSTSPAFFPAGGTFIEGATITLEIAKKYGFKHYGAVFCAEAAQCQLAIAFLKAQAGKVGIDFAYGGTVSSSAADYTATCLAAKDAGVDIMELGVATYDTGLNIAKSCARQGYHPAWIIPGEAISDKYLGSPLFNNAFGSPADLPWFADVPANADFKAAMAAANLDLTTSDLPLTATDAWAAGLLFEKAVQLSGATGVPTSADILAGLAKVKDETLGGFVPPLTFTTPTNKPVPCFFVLRIQNQQFTLPQGTQVTCNPATS
jgi:branched-chain amino acid transport system substrate-binding protein